MLIQECDQRYLWRMIRMVIFQRRETSYKITSKFNDDDAELPIRKGTIQRTEHYLEFRGH